MFVIENPKLCCRCSSGTCKRSECREYTGAILDVFAARRTDTGMVLIGDTAWGKWVWPEDDCMNPSGIFEGNLFFGVHRKKRTSP